MLSEHFSRRTRSMLSVWMALGALTFAAPAFAQSGKISGKVTDAAGKIVADAKIVVNEVVEKNGQKWETKSDKNGNYVVGTISKSGQYLVRAEKSGVGTDEQRVSVTVGSAANLNFSLSNKPVATDAQIAKNAALKKIFDEGVAAAIAGNHQAAADAFTQATVAMPTCAECFFNVGVSHAQLKNYDAAEAAYKKAIELRPAYPEAYNALSLLYMMQKKMDLASEASAKAMELVSAAPGGGSPDSMYAAGIGLWNTNKFPEAQQAFEAALKADPNYADAHFMLAKVNLNLGKLAEAAGEFQAYLKIAPTGKNAAEAQATYDQLKPLLPK